MQIDWITVAAQIINFLILVYLLKRFLYTPVLNAMAQRSQRIANQLNEAEQRESEAQNTTKLFQDKTDELEQQREEWLAKAREDAETLRLQLVDDIRKDIDHLREQWQQQLEREQRDFLSAVKKQTAELIEKISRKALSDLADMELEQQMVKTFLNRLESLTQQDKELLMESAHAVKFTTSFKLTDDMRNLISAIIHRQLMPGIEIQFTQSPELLCGIEMSTEGRKIGWTVADYFSELERNVSEMLKRG